MLETHWERRLVNMAGQIADHRNDPINSSWAADVPLEKAYQLCDQLSAEHSKSFYMASGLLPKDKRSAVRALYAFCRTVDDIVDEGTTNDRDVELDYWRAIVRGAQQPRANDLIGQAWTHTRLHYHIPTQYALQLIDGVSCDLGNVRYQTFDELATYCYGVASTVGLMSMYVVGFKTAEAVPYAIKLGVALQMTNILRDVGEDFRNGRIYLPQQELYAYSLTNEDLASGVVDARWREFMNFQIYRTRQLYVDASRGLRYLERDGQMSIGAASGFYQGILEAIEANGYDVFHKRASLSAWNKLRRLPSLWWQLNTMG